MAKLSSPWLRNKFSYFYRSAKRRPFRKADHRRLHVESLEERTLLTTWADIANAYTTAAAQVRQIAPILVNSTFVQQIPFVRDSVRDALHLAEDLQASFRNLTELPERFCDEFRNAGFTVQPCSLIPDAQNDLVRLSKDFTFNVTPRPFSLGGIGGNIGFNNPNGSPGYFDDHSSGSLSGSLQASVQPITLHVAFGLDAASGLPQLYLADETNLQVRGVTGRADVTGTMNLRNLLNVDIRGTGTLNLGGNLSIRSRPELNHKLHLPDLTTDAVTGGFNGTIGFDAQLTTRLPILPDVTWHGSFSHNVVTHQSDFHLDAPDPLATLRNIVGGFFSGGNGFNFLSALSPISDALNFRLPIFNTTLGEKLGIPSNLLNLGNLPNLNHALQDLEDNILNPLHIYIGLPDNVPDNPQEMQRAQIRDLSGLITAIDNVIHGNRQNLLTFAISGGSHWDTSRCFTFLSLGPVGVANVHLDACFGGYVGWDYSVRLGIDTTGFYVDPSTHIGVNGGIWAGLRGGLSVLGFDLASAEGRIGLNANARLGLRHPDPGQGDRIYLDQIFRPGENLFQRVLGIVQADFTIDVVAHVEAKINLLFTRITVWSHDWNLGRIVNLHFAPQQTQTRRDHPLNLVTRDLTQDPGIRMDNGVLTIDGRNSTDANLILLSGRDGTADVNWQGHGTGHFTGVRQINFLGGSHDDRLETSPGFNVPINAQGGNGNNYFEAGDGNSSLYGGGGNPTLVGGAGHDSLVGGLGNSVLIAGAGDSTLIGGGSNASLYGGSGRDLLIGGTSASADDATTGHVYIEGGSGDSTIWAGGGVETIVAGSGNDQIHGGRGVYTGPPHYDTSGNLIREDGDLIIAGATADPSDPRYFLAGHDTVYGGNGYNTIIGGANDDLLYSCPQDSFREETDGRLTNINCNSHSVIKGGIGNNRINGGPNGDLLMAGTGNDTIRAMAGNNTLVAGRGEDWLYAGSGDDLLRVPFGVTQGSVRSHFVGGTGRATLSIATDGDNHFLRLTQSAPNTFTVTSFADATMSRALRAFTFELPSDIHGNFIENLALEAINGDNRLEVAPNVLKNVKLIGGSGSDSLVGGGGRNTFLAGTGNNTLIGGPATGTNYNEFHGCEPNDMRPCAGSSKVTMIGGPGNDVFYGGVGCNDMRGGSGQVIMYGGRGCVGDRDRMSVAANNPIAIMTAGQNDVTMYGGSGRNVLTGGPGQNEMHGGGTDDVLTGGSGPTIIYGGAGYGVITGGTGNTTIYANGPQSRAFETIEDWHQRYNQLHSQLDDLQREENRLFNLLHPWPTDEQCRSRPTDEPCLIKARHDMIVLEDGIVAAQLVVVDHQYFTDGYGRATIYNVPNIIKAGGGPTTIYGSAFANVITANDPNNPDPRIPATTIYSAGGDDTITGTAGRDKFFIPPIPGNANVTFGAQQDLGGNWVPAVNIRSGPLNLTELVHVRGIDQIGVITGSGNNTVHVDLEGHVLQGLNGINVECGSGNNSLDFRGFPGKVTVQAGSGSDTILGGSPTGIEIRAGTGFSTYLFNGTGGNDNMSVVAEAYQSQPVLSFYVGSQIQTRMFQPAPGFTPVKRLLIQGVAGNHNIVLGPMGVFTFRDLIVDAGRTNGRIDARVVAQGVTLLGGGGSDTLVGGSGPNYLYGGSGNVYFQNFKSTDTVVGGGGNDRFEGFDADMPLRNWTSAMLSGGSGDSIGVGQHYDPAHGYFLYGSHSHATGNYQTEDPTLTTINAGHTFSGMGAYIPSVQGPIASLDFEFDFSNLNTSPVQAGILLIQGDSYFYGGLSTFQNQSWQHRSFSLSSNSFTRIQGTQFSTPNFASSVPIQFGLFTSTTGAPTPHYHRGQRVCDPVIRPPYCWYESIFDGFTPQRITWGANNYKVVINAATPSVQVPIGLATTFRLTPSNASTVAGTPFSVTLMAMDSSGNPAFRYRGTVALSSSDALAGLPANYTFTPADNGMHTFTVTLRSLNNQMITARDTANGTLVASTSVNVVPTGSMQVTPSANSPTAGTSFTITVTVAPGYRGTVTFSSTDRQAGLPANYTFTAADNGVHTFTITLRTAGLQAVTITDTVGRSFTGSVDLTVLPAAASRLEITAPANDPAGSPFTITAKAYDPFGNVATGYLGLVTFTSSDPQAVLPPDYRFTTGDQGVHTFTVTLKTAGGRSITATDAANHLTAGANVVVIPGPAVSFRVSSSTSSVSAGTAFTVTVSARDAYDNVVTSYTGMVAFGSSDRQAVLPNNYAFTAADQGSHTFPVTLKTAGEQTVTATDTPLRLFSGTVRVTVLPAAASRLEILLSGRGQAGVALTMTVRARDAYDNIATTYASTVTFTSSDPQAVLPDDYTFTATDRGERTFPVTLKTAGTQTVTATDTAIGSISGSAGLLITPAAASNFQVAGFPSPSTAGVEGTFTVTAFDPFGNIDTNYQGTVHFTSNDSQAALPADYTFLLSDSGVHSFNATLKTAGSDRFIRVADLVSSQIAGSQDNIAVTPAAADHFRIDAPAHVAPNTPFDVSVTALDPYGNVDVNYRGTVTFTTTDLDSGVVLPIDYTFTDDDQGVHSFSAGITLVTAGDQVITVADLDNGLSTDATVTVDDAGPNTPEHSGVKDRIHAPLSASPARRSPLEAVLPSRAIDRLFAEPTELEWASWITAHRASSPR